MSPGTSIRPAMKASIGFSSPRSIRSASSASRVDRGGRRVRDLPRAELELDLPVAAGPAGDDERGASPGRRRAGPARPGSAGRRGRPWPAGAGASPGRKIDIACRATAAAAALPERAAPIGDTLADGEGGGVAGRLGHAQAAVLPTSKTHSPPPGPVSWMPSSRPRRSAPGGSPAAAKALGRKSEKKPRARPAKPERRSRRRSSSPA